MQKEFQKANEFDWKLDGLLAVSGGQSVMQTEVGRWSEEIADLVSWIGGHSRLSKTRKIWNHESWWIWMVWCWFNIKQHVHVECLSWRESSAKEIIVTIDSPRINYVQLNNFTFTRQHYRVPQVLSSLNSLTTRSVGQKVSPLPITSQPQSGHHCSQTRCQTRENSSHAC